jgi:Mn2+/Fe2+ NRAMP family transporter
MPDEHRRIVRLVREKPETALGLLPVSGCRILPLVFPRMPPLGKAPVPRFPGAWAVLGPGVVWMALAQGSGELIWWPYLVAKYGLAFVFLLLPACLLQWPLTFEIGRYTALTGESIWQGFMRLHPWFAFPLWILMVVSFLWFGAFASAGGTALAALTHWPPGWSPRAQSLVWAYATIAVFLGGLLASPVLYRFIERFMFAVAAVTLIGLAAACAHPDVWSRAPRFLTALVRPDWPPARPWDPADASPLLTAVAFAGLGGFWTLFYSYWLREKGFAMAAHAGRVAGLRGRPEVIPQSGAVPTSDDGDAPSLRRWIRYLWIDSGIGVVGNIVTTAMTCLLAYALLTPRGILPQGWDIAVVQSRFFSTRWGAFGQALFLLIAAAFLADTWLSTVDAVSRVNSDVVHHLFPRSRRRTPRWWYFFFLAVLTAVTCLTMPLAQPGPLIVISALTGFLGTVIFSVAVLVLNHHHLPRHLPPFARPGRLTGVLLAVVCVAYFGFAVAYLWAAF